MAEKPIRRFVAVAAIILVVLTLPVAPFGATARWFEMLVLLGLASAFTMSRTGQAQRAAGLV